MITCLTRQHDGKNQTEQKYKKMYSNIALSVVLKKRILII